MEDGRLSSISDLPSSCGASRVPGGHVAAPRSLRSTISQNALKLVKVAAEAPLRAAAGLSVQHQGPVVGGGQRFPVTLHLHCLESESELLQVPRDLCPYLLLKVRASAEHFHKVPIGVDQLKRGLTIPRA